MENQNTLLWMVSIVAVVGIVAMVIATTRPEPVSYSATDLSNTAGEAKAFGCTTKQGSCSASGACHDVGGPLYNWQPAYRTYTTTCDGVATNSQPVYCGRIYGCSV